MSLCSELNELSECGLNVDIAISFHDLEVQSPEKI